ncbi:MAG: putative cystathionine gamma-lyase, partial [Modestobacter sp.]|nr:putative cystathionine gamma-lyase [Modestobacter sp.]
MTTAEPSGPPSDSPLGDGTRLVHAGDDPAVPGTPLRPSPVFAAPYHLGDQPPGWQGADGYARPDNPTLRVF